MNTYKMNTYIAIVESKYNHQDVIHILGGIGDIAELFENAFLIKTRYTAVDIRNELYDSLEDEPSIYVCKLARGSAWKNASATSAEIKGIYSNEEE